jgi:hypothetical protein
MGLVFPGRILSIQFSVQHTDAADAADPLTFFRILKQSVAIVALHVPLKSSDGVNFQNRMAPKLRTYTELAKHSAAAIALIKQMKSSHQRYFVTLVLKHAFANSVKIFGCVMRSWPVWQCLQLFFIMDMT